MRARRCLLVQLEIPLAAVRAATAHTHGIVVLNPAPPADLPPELLAQVDVLVPNERELLRLAGARRARRVDRTRWPRSPAP